MRSPQVMTKKSKIIYLFVSIIFFILLNGYMSDLIILNAFKLPENPIFSITYVQNQGAAFNIFEGQRIFLIVFALAAISGMIFYIVKHINKFSGLGLFFASILTSGIFNNMIERTFMGYVRDFIKLNFVDFPVFNISDIFINIGVLGLIILIILRGHFRKLF